MSNEPFQKRQCLKVSQLKTWMQEGLNPAWPFWVKCLFQCGELLKINIEKKIVKFPHFSMEIKNFKDT